MTIFDKFPEEIVTKYKGQYRAQCHKCGRFIAFKDRRVHRDWETGYWEDWGSECPKGNGCNANTLGD